ncbi:hypothetical protein IE53DRAFT_369565 [Violaceomyces palustris]|uniref:Uncharacterized protein n=1 Tax=Violaceomyces palustris TaxID=1673888 RepID=A0ACD0NV49_9BASI|nr:hypothetical protein IE53DRAFT_369565 [Violaceomyces palustris]
MPTATLTEPIVATSTPIASSSAKNLLFKAPTVKAKINYLDRSVEKPFLYLYPDRPEGEPENNFVYSSQEVQITDLRRTTPEERERSGFNTRQAGFQIVDGWGDQGGKTAKAWEERRWDEKGWIESEYYADIDLLMKRELGVTSTFIFDHTVRKRRSASDQHLPDDAENRKPVQQAHCDQSRKAGENRILKHLGEEVLEKVKRGELHAQLVNVWRPLRGEAWDTPLAFADSRTVSRGEDGKPLDWKPSELKYKTWSGETLAIHSNPDHRWYYYSGLPTSKSVFLKCYDSETETRTPHTAFEDPTTPEDSEPRWSIEVRVLAITDPKLKQAGGGALPSSL